MAHNEMLGIRLRDIFSEIGESTEKKMFGGIAYLINGNMSCGVHKDNLIVRIGPENYKEALKKPHVEEMNITGKSMRGWIMISAKHLENDADLYYWANMGIAFTKTLPKK